MAPPSLQPAAPTESHAAPSAPSGPCFLSSIRGHFTFDDPFVPPTRGSLAALTGGYFNSLRVFDSAGRLWTVAGVESNRRKSALASLLASVTNPAVTVSITWAAPARYPIADLQAEYTRAVDRDDDILTQFVDREELRARIASAADFASLAKVFAWAGTDPDD